MAMSNNVRVAVDAMGGDFAPREIVIGAVQAAAAGGVEIFLVGEPDTVSRELASLDYEGLPIKVIPSEGVVMEGESPIQVMRQKPQASILITSGLVKAKQAQAMVSMGSTGATMAAAVHLLGLLEGIERPALGGPIIGLAPETVLGDLGSNLDCRPGQLLGFAALGSILPMKVFPPPVSDCVFVPSSHVRGGEQDCRVCRQGAGPRCETRLLNTFQKIGVNFQTRSRQFAGCVRLAASVLLGFR